MPIRFKWAAYVSMCVHLPPHDGSTVASRCDDAASRVEHKSSDVRVFPRRASPTCLPLRAFHKVTRASSPAVASSSPLGLNARLRTPVEEPESTVNAIVATKREASPQSPGGHDTRRPKLGFYGPRELELVALRASSCEIFRWKAGRPGGAQS